MAGGTVTCKMLKRLQRTQVKLCVGICRSGAVFLGHLHEVCLTAKRVSSQTGFCFVFFKVFFCLLTLQNNQTYFLPFLHYTKTVDCVQTVQ